MEKEIGLREDAIGTAFSRNAGIRVVPAGMHCSKIQKRRSPST